MKKILLLLAVVCSCTLSAQYIHVQENFNDTILPTGWITTAVNGIITWSFGIDGSAFNPGNNNLDGTSMTYFDDDALGSGALNNTAQLVTPVFDNTTYLNTTLEFDYNFRQLIGPLDSFYVEVFDGLNWNTVFSVTTNDCGNWLGACRGNFPKATLDISAYSNANCQVRFTYFDGNDWGWYVGMDNVVISSKFNTDLGVAELVSPISKCGLSANEQVVVGVNNFGGDTIRNFSVSCNINNGAFILIDTVSATIIPGDTFNYTFQNTVDLSLSGNYTFQLNTDLLLDTNLLNDSLNSSVSSFFVNNPSLFQNFETTNNFSSNGINASWAIGVPTGIIIDSAYSDSIAYVTNLSGNYNNNEESFLYTPCFDIAQMNGSPRLTFWLNYDTELNNDKLEMEYTLDDGLTWSRLESEISPQNWYPANMNWSGSSAGWIEVINTLPSIVGYTSVSFRFRFLSNATVTGEGAAIDNFRFEEVNDIDISLDSLLSPRITTETNCGVRIEPVSVAFSNIGLNLVDTVFLSYQVDNGMLFNDTLVQRILPGDTLSYTFNDSIRFLRVGNHQLNISLRVNGELKTNNNSLSNLIIPNTQFPSSASLPFYEPFNQSNFSSGSVNFNTDDAIGNGWTRSSAFTWRMVGNRRFRTYNNGPSKDNTGNNGLFAYVESNSGVVGDTAILESRCIDLNTVSSASLEFNYHRYSVDPLSDLFIDVFDGNQWVVADTISGNTQTSANDNWSLASVNLDSFVGADIKVRFRTIKQSCCEQGTAIDDILIFERKSQDVGVFVVTVNEDGCSFSDTLKVKIRNRGIQSIPGSIPVAYRINGGATVNETAILPIPLNSQTEFNYTFNNLINLDQGGEYKLEVWTNLTNDSNRINDSSSLFLVNHTKQINQYFENFDSFLDGTCGSAPRLINYGDLLLNGWMELSSNLFGWNVQGSNCGGTPSIFTGPTLDHTGKGGNYLFTETTGIARNALDTAVLQSPCIDLSIQSSAAMRFWYHRYGSFTGDLYIDVFANGVWNLEVDSIIGQTQTSSADPWKLKKVLLNQFVGQSIVVRFRALFGGQFQGDMAIDDVEFYSPIQQDARLTKIDLTQASCEQDNAQLLLTANNFGLDSILPYQIKVKYQVGLGAVVSDSNVVGLTVDSNLTFSLNITNLYNSNNQRITAWVELPNDSNSFNDTLFYDINLPARAPDYTEGFENIITSAGQCANYNASLNLAWEIDLNDQWVAGHDTLCNYGTSGATPIALTGPDSAYAGNGFMYFEPAYNSVIDTANLISTCIDLRNDSISYLDFYYHMYGAGTGKLYVDAMANGVSTRLDSIVGQQHFSASDPWSLKTINLNQFAGDIILIRFTAIESPNTSISDQGAISIDNVRISNSFPVSINEATTNNSFQLFPNPTNGEFTLRGTDYTSNELVLSVLDMNGRVIESRIVNPNSNSINERFDLSNQANGVYFISIRSEGKVEVKKVVLSGR